MRRWLVSGLFLVACSPTPVVPAVSPKAATAVVRGELPKPAAWQVQSRSWQVQAVSLQSVVLVQAEIGGPGLTTPMTAQAALDPDFHFAVPFAAVPLGENRPVTVVGYGIDGRPIPGIVLQGWLTVTAEGFRGQASAAATPVGAALRRLWQLAPTDSLAAVVARELAADDLQTFVTGMNQQFSQDYSLMDGDRIAMAILKANRDRTAFDIRASGVRLPAPNGDLLRHAGAVRGTLYGARMPEDTLRSLSVDDPLSPTFTPVPTVNGTPFLFYPVVPGLRRLTGIYGPTGNTAVRQRYSRTFMASDDSDSLIDFTLPHVTPRQVPPGGTVQITGMGFGLEVGTASLGTVPTSTTLPLAKWSDTELRLTLPTPLPSGPAELQLTGRTWQLAVQPLQLLPGPPRIESATVVPGPAGHSLQLTGSNFSAYAGDHRLNLIGSDRIAVPVPVTMNGANLAGAVPAGVTGSMEVHLSIGDIEAVPVPTVTF
ncbi:MAG: hypothetical protein H7338_10200 [Candidatus Sericytochromatia bacterium]|nr:hypothetical protein [Candidatus Sericytochromatia bacterium]